MTPLFWVMTPRLKGHGDSRYLFLGPLCALCPSYCGCFSQEMMTPFAFKGMVTCLVPMRDPKAPPFDRSRRLQISEAREGLFQHLAVHLRPMPRAFASILASASPGVPGGWRHLAAQKTGIPKMGCPIKWTHGPTPAL